MGMDMFGIGNKPAMAATQTPVQGVAGGNGGSFAQKQQMAANPMMKNKAAMAAGPMGAVAQGAGNVASAWKANKMQKPNTGLANPMAALGQAVPGQGGSNSMQQQKMLQLKNQQAAAQGSPIGGSYNQLLQANPQLANYRNTGQNAGQDMSWMDQPGALQMPLINTPPAGPSEQGYGIKALVPPGDMPKTEPTGGVQAGAANQVGMTSPYNEPDVDMGSQDPRELARMGNVQQGLAPGGPSMRTPPFGGENPGSNGFQDMMSQMGGQRPDVMPRGLGPSMMPEAVQMDENGLEPRRGAR